MIRIIPNATRTLVTVLDKTEIYYRLQNVTTGRMRLQNRIIDKNILLVGSVRPDGFNLALKVPRPTTFLPTVRGKVESTKSGSLVFLQFRLFTVTSVYLIFWLLFILMAGVVIAHQYRLPILLLSPLLLDAVIVWIAWANFNMLLRLTIQTLEEVLNP